MSLRPGPRTYQLCTGDCAWYTSRTDWTRTALGIGTADDGQALIEHLVLSHLQAGSAYAPHPIAIRTTRVLTDRTEVHLDERAVIDDDHRDIAEHAVELLPFDPGPGELGGI